MNGGTIPLVQIFPLWDVRILVYHQDSLVDANTMVYFSFLPLHDRRSLMHLAPQYFRTLEIIKEKLERSRPIVNSK
jgi:hypothetical protein